MRWGVVALAACGHPTYSTVDATPTAQLDVPCDVAIVRHGRELFVFDAGAATIVRGGQAVVRVPAPQGGPWVAASALVGPDRQRWIVGISGGALWRITPDGDVEAAGAHLGIGAGSALAIEGSGTTFAIGLTDGVVASRDGTHVLRFAGGQVPYIAVAGALVAVGRTDGVEVYDLEHMTRVAYGAEGVTSVAFIDEAAPHPRLVVNAGGALYIEDHGLLKRIATPVVDHVATSGSRVWLIAGADLLTIEPNGPVQIDGARGAYVFDAGGGAAWLARDRQVVRLALGTSEQGAWQTAVAPVFERACAKCHRADGRAELDLSTSDAWLEHADEIRDVLATGEMPPEGNDLGDADRDALARWLAR